METPERNGFGRSRWGYRGGQGAGESSDESDASSSDDGSSGSSDASAQAVVQSSEGLDRVRAQDAQDQYAVVTYAVLQEQWELFRTVRTVIDADWLRREMQQQQQRQAQAQAQAQAQPGMQIVQVVIPAGAMPGSQFPIQTSSGAQFMVTVPAGTMPGQMMSLQVPATGGAAAPTATPQGP